MWRFAPSKRIPKAELSLDYANNPIAPTAVPNMSDVLIEDLPAAVASPVVYGKYDNPSREQELSDIYDDIRKYGFPNRAEQIYTILKRFPELDININRGKKEGFMCGSETNTLLNSALCNSYTGVARALINNPTISKSTLEAGLNYLKFIERSITLNKNQLKIKELIENKLQSMEKFQPSAPPLQEDFAPSAPPLQEDFTPSAPPLMTSYQIRNLDSGEIGDIRNFSNASVGQSLNLPNVPTHQPLNLPNVPTHRRIIPNKSAQNMISRLFGSK